MSKYVNGQYPVNIALDPASEQGPRAATVTLLFPQNGGTLSDDLSLENQNGTINNVQAVYIDNGANANYFQLTLTETGQIIDVAPYTQGYYPIACHQQVSYTAILGAFGSSGSYQATVNLIFFNCEVQPCQWQTDNIIPYSATATSITAGSTGVNSGSALLGKRDFITGFIFSSNGATAAGTINITFTNLLLTPPSIIVSIPVIGSGATFFQFTFPQPQPATNLFLVIGANVPSSGAGNTFQSFTMFGYHR